ncbi:MAG TPA: hypothetical protein VGF79_00820 [Bacteroidia bacterium]
MKYEIIFNIAGQDVLPPTNWMNIDIIAAYEDSIQPQIEIDSFRFVNETALLIKRWINYDQSRSNGPSIFDGIPFTMQIYSDQLQKYINYDGILDTTEIEFINETELTIKIKPYDGLEYIDQMLQSITYGLLAQKKFITENDYIEVPVIIRKKFDGLETTLVSVSLFLIYDTTHNWIKENKESIVKTFKALTFSTPTQKPADLYEAIAFAIQLIAYTAILLITVTNLLKSLVKNLLPIPVKYKGMTLRTMLTKAFAYFDIDFQSEIRELDWYVYLPSKTDNKIRKNRQDEGIPNTDDFGYQCIEALNTAIDLFRAKSKMTVINNRRTFILIPEKSERLQKNSGYQLPNELLGANGLLMEKFRFNTDEFRGNFILSFQYDPADEYTMPNEKDSDSKQYEKGVFYEVATELANPIENKNRLTKGLEDVRIKLALGARRNKLSAMEYAAKTLLMGIDSFIKILGGKTFNEKIDENKGKLVISQNSFNVPKLVVIRDGIIPKNHRDLLSAKYLYNNYHYVRSFKEAPEFSQKKIYEGVRIPFSFEDYLKTYNNSFFEHNGTVMKFRHIKWNLSSDTAVATIEEPFTYVNQESLKETPVEP